MRKYRKETTDNGERNSANTAKTSNNGNMTAILHGNITKTHWANQVRIIQLSSAKQISPEFSMIQRTQKTEALGWQTAVAAQCEVMISAR